MNGVKMIGCDDRDGDEAAYRRAVASGFVGVVISRARPRAAAPVVAATDASLAQEWFGLSAREQSAFGGQAAYIAFRRHESAGDITIVGTK
jgi:hypothetical protein